MIPPGRMVMAGGGTTLKTLSIVAVLGACAVYTTCAYAEPSTADLLASSPNVPPPTSLPSVPSQEWCEIVDAALKNPNASPARKEEYIAVGQANHCPHQMFLEPRKRAVRPPLSPQQWCDTAFQLLANLNVDPCLKQATLEKMRNRGCLR